MPKRAEFTNTRLILAEGNEDAAFVRALLRGRKNLPAFDVSPNIDVAEVGGSSGFGDAIIACEPIIGFGNVTDVVILADNDDALPQRLLRTFARNSKEPVEMATFQETGGA